MTFHCIFFTKVEVKGLGVEIYRLFGLYHTYLPAKKIASVDTTFTAVKVETTGGKTFHLTPWGGKKDTNKLALAIKEIL